MKVDFLPGTMCDHRLWSYLAPLLGSSVEPNYIALDDISVRDELRQRLSDEITVGANVIAFSMGGYLALEHAVRLRGQLRSLVVVASSARGLSSQEKRRRQRLVGELSSKSYAGISRNQIAAMLGKKANADTEIVDIIMDMDRTLGARTLLAQINATMNRPDLMADLSVLECPVLFVGSTDDPLVSVSHLEEMHRAVLGSELRLFSGIGHMVPLEAPQDLADEIASFHEKLIVP